MQKNIKNIIIGVVLVVLFIAGLVYWAGNSGNVATDPKMDAFAQCLKDKGAAFYGAFWCSHCNNQKKLLGNSKNIPYTECSTADGKGQLQVCIDKKIEGYPTWIFADGTTQSGEVSLQQLSDKTSCQLP